MGKKIQEIGDYEITEKTLGKGDFSRIEFALHKLAQCEVRARATPIEHCTTFLQTAPTNE